MLFIDFKQAFDSVPLEKLLEILDHLQIDSNTIQIIKLLLNSAYVSYNKDLTIPVNQQVPQGGKTSPLLFIIFVNELIERLKKHIIREEYIFMYADDLCICCLNYNYLKKAIMEIEKYCKDFDMELNKNKSGIIKISKRCTEKDL